jgi:hypothetical protein
MGMGRSAFRKMASSLLVLIFPASMMAADSGAAMLYTNGTAWVNGAHVPRSSSAIFVGDLLQTKADSVANINASGSTVTVLSDSLVQFEGSSLNLEHGAVTVSTSTKTSAAAGDVKVSPTSNSWTEFNVTDVDGMVKIAARKGDLTVSDGKDTFTLAQGQETTREETSEQQDQDKDKTKKKNRRKGAAAATPAAQGGLLNSPLLVKVGAGVIGGVMAGIILAHDDDPVSPAKP